MTLHGLLSPRTQEWAVYVLSFSAFLFLFLNPIWRFFINTLNAYSNRLLKKGQVGRAMRLRRWLSPKRRSNKSSHC